MKINMNDAYRIYTKNSSLNPQMQEHRQRQDEKAPVGNVDTVTISSDGMRRSEIDKLANSVSLQVEATVSSQRLESLRQAVQNGSYRVGTEQLAEAVFRALV